MRVLFVCLGNICRSTMAEGVFRNLMEKENLSMEIECDSAGTANYHIGSKADKRTLSVLSNNGIELPHLGRQIEMSDFDNFDFVLAMDKNNFIDINKLYQSAKTPKAKVMMMRKFDLTQSESDVPDPYYGEKKDFENVYEIVKEASLGFLQYLKNEKLV